MVTGRKGLNLGVAMALGAAAGVVVGGFTDNFGLWLPIGIAAGFAAGLLFPESSGSGPSGPPPA